MRRVWSIQIGATKRFLRPWEGWKATHWLSKRAPICYPPFPVSVFNTLSDFKLNSMTPGKGALTKWKSGFYSVGSDNTFHQTIDHFWSFFLIHFLWHHLSMLYKNSQSSACRVPNSRLFLILVWREFTLFFLSTLKYFFWKWWNINKE